MKKRMHLIIKGRVQGVGYRFTTRTKAKILGLTGWVKNLPDETVEILAEGEESSLQKLLTWCYKGPSLSYVIDIEEKWKKNKDEFTTFSIKY